MFKEKPELPKEKEEIPSLDAIIKRMIHSYDILKPEEERSLGEEQILLRSRLKEDRDNEGLIKELDQVRNELVLHNLRIIPKIIFKEFYSHRDKFVDLFSVGVIGLVQAADVFDPNTARFPALAAECVRNEITSAIPKEGKTIIFPEYFFSIAKIYKEEESKFRKENKILPEDKLTPEQEEELVAQIIEQLSADLKKAMSREEIKKIPEYLERGKNIISLDKEREEGESLKDILPAETKTPEEVLLEQFEQFPKDLIVKILSDPKFRFSSKEHKDKKGREILKMRLGIDEYQKHTLQDIGDKFGVTKEAIRQREERIFNKIKAYLEQTGQWEKIKEEIS